MALVLGSTPGCGPAPVEARAIWVDGFGGPGRRQIHVYDRGAIEAIEVLGGTEPTERVRLDPRGRGVLIRSGERRGAWFDLDDGRRMPLLLPPSSITGQSLVGFAHEALIWIDPSVGSLAVVPLAPWLPLARREDGTPEPLIRPGSGSGSGSGSGPAWAIAAAAAPVVLIAEPPEGRASFLRYPTRPDQPLTLALEATAVGLSLPSGARESRSCATSLGCYVDVAVDPSGELAIVAQSPGGPWESFDRRAPSQAGALELPPALAEARAGAGLRLLQVLDRRVSVWIGAGQLYRYDRGLGRVEQLGLSTAPPLVWFSVAQGRGLVLVSRSGLIYRADLEGLRELNGESPACFGVGEPIVSPRGDWVAWSCIDGAADLALASVIVRASSAGLERFGGVPMAPLAIDDSGALLLYSSGLPLVEVEGLAVTGRPRNLFVLDQSGVLTRIDDLEPAPAPVLVGAGERAAYIQGVALAGTP